MVLASNSAFAQNKNTEKEDLSGFTFEGPEINLIKKAVQHFTKGELKAYRACFTDSATLCIINGAMITRNPLMSWLKYIRKPRSKKR
jgi:hypothetical protein